MANLVLTTLLNWLGEMLSINRKSHIIDQMMTLWIFDTPKSWAFGKITKKCLINSIL